MNRHVAAFLLAPLIVPMLVSALALQILREAPSLYWLGLMTAAAASYGGAILAGAPVYVALRSGGRTAFWIAPVAGFALGIITAIGVMALFLAVAQSGALSSLLEIMPGAAQTGEVILAPNTQIWYVEGPPVSLIGPGILGAFVGMALWLIGRPDRP